MTNAERAVRTDSAQCPHSDMDIHFHMMVMVDSNVGSLHVWASCKVCGKKLALNRGLPRGASSLGPTRDSEETLGLLIPVIAEGEEPTKEWGFFLSGPHLVESADNPP
jgi:hypothetical protein